MTHTKSIYQILKAIDLAFEEQNFNYKETLSIEKLKISSHRLNLLIGNLIEDNFVQGFEPVYIMNEIQFKAINPSLTTAGMDYLENNSSMKKLTVH